MVRGVTLATTALSCSTFPFFYRARRCADRFVDADRSKLQLWRCPVSRLRVLAINVLLVDGHKLIAGRWCIPVFPFQLLLFNEVWHAHAEL